MKFRMSHCKAASTPVATGLKLTKNGEGRPMNLTLYRCIIGSLQYLTNTRPDIAYGIALLRRYFEATGSHIGSQRKEFFGT